jgi:general secretion pathway protein D
MNWFLAGFIFASIAIHGLHAETEAEGGVSETASFPRTVTSAEMTQREIDRRREAVFRMNENLDLAERLYAAGEWKLAQEKYRMVMKQTDPQTTTSGFYHRARTGVAKSVAAQALAMEKEGKTAEAAGLMKQASDLDSTNVLVAKQAATLQEEASRVSDPFDGNSAATADLVEKTKEIKKLLSLADQLIETGQYRSARKKLDDVLRIDPYNRAARKKIELVEQKRLLIANKRYDASRVKALAQVTEAWIPPPPAKIDPSKTRGTGSAGPSRAAEILKELSSIEIPEIIFSEKPLREAVEELQRLSELNDPNKKGINFVLRLPLGSGSDPESATVSLELRKVKLQTALKYLCEQIRGGEKLRFEVEDNAVFLLPATESGGELETRSYTLPPTLIADLSTPETDPAKVGDLVLSNIGADAKIQGSKAVCFRDTGKLVVRNIAREHAKIEQRIRDSSNENPQKQFEIESKFLQFTENDLKNFTFNYNISATASVPNSLVPGVTPSPIGAGTQTTGLRGTAGLDPNGVALAGLKQLLDPNNLQANSNQIGVNGQIFNKGFSAILQLLQNALGKDLVAAPRVICADGKDSEIFIGREMRYPTTYSQPVVPQNDSGQGAGFILPGNPGSFEPRSVGVTLKVNASSTVLPTAVDIKIDKLEVVDFSGFLNYGTIINSVTTGTPRTVDIITGLVTDPGEPPVAGSPSQSPYLVPVFARKSVTSQIRMLDGQTFAIGGLLAEADQMVDDSVPILGDLPIAGRLFRSEVSQRVKNNLVVFTTVRIIKPDGTLQFPEDEENPEFAQSGSAEMMPSVP